METPDFVNDEPAEPEPPHRPVRPAQRPLPQPRGGLFSAGAGISWIAGLILALSSFMDWYAGSSTEGPPLAVIGWHTGTLGKLVFFIGLAVVAHAVLGDFGFELPATVPDSLVVVALGSLGTIFVLIRLISIPDTFGLTPGRGIGIWIALVSALAVIVGGLLRAGEEI